MIRDDLDIVNLLKTIHKLKACIIALTTNQDDVIDRAREIYS